MKCPQCVDAGLTSQVRDADPIATNGKTEKFWDEDGARHVHSSKRTITNLRCSQGHTWQHEGRMACQTCGVPVDP